MGSSGSQASASVSGIATGRMSLLLRLLAVALVMNACHMPLTNAKATGTGTGTGTSTATGTGCLPYHGAC
ncbi:GL14450 [Drosophila persimilis]|uniref:GL14450 n=1 Tax=Drosophila persimilis TaxID=7234 RepID=B4GTZ8_DROPE|nr:GL14450 [Drosophila persimilis]